MSEKQYIIPEALFQRICRFLHKARTDFDSGDVAQLLFEVFNLKPAEQRPDMTEGGQQHERIIPD